jgi:hypothetical protein
VFNPSMPGGDTISSDQWDQYIQAIGASLQASSGSTQRALEAQMKDAAAGRANAIALEKMRDETSRYGIDAQRETALKQLTENARQFDATHALDMQKFGLMQQQFGVDYAKAYSDYVLQPDRYAAGADFVNMASRALTGQGGPAPYNQNTFTPKSSTDFAVLTGTQPNGQGAGGFTNPTAPAPPPGGAATAPAATGGQQYATDAAAQGGVGSDARVAAIKKILDAVPPSQTDGLNSNDYAVLQAAGALMSTNLQAGTLERMRPDQQAIYKSYVQRSGRDWNDYLSDYKRQGIGQKSPGMY